MSCNIDFTKNDDISIYLGPNIYPLAESDWMNNQSMVSQATTLVSGKNANMDKAVAIANWVKQSRPYDNDGSSSNHLTPANKLLSVVDIYNESTGICLDSAIITVAMFRLAGIPARLEFPTFGISHARAQAYINGQWFTFDSTFGSGPAEINIVQFPPHEVSYFGKLDNPSLYKQSPMQPEEYLGWHVFKQFNIADNDSVFGKLTLANIPSNIKLYTNDSLADADGHGYPVYFEVIRTDEKNFYYAICTGWNNDSSQIRYSFGVQPPELCADMRGSSGTIQAPNNAIFMRSNLMFLDGFNNFVQGTQMNSAIDLYGSYRYLETEKLPLGKYRVTYYANLPIGRDESGGRTNIAYADFNVLQGSTAKLTADKFNIVSGANQEYFNDVIRRLNSTWTNCESNCAPSWQCGAWSACANGKQTRTCTDSNNCGIVTDKPATTQNCSTLPSTPNCANLYSKIQAAFRKICGVAGYDFIADLNKDKSVNNADHSLFSANFQNEAWCGQQLSSTTNPCSAIKPSITVISPNGGETWQIGQKNRILWSSKGLLPTDKVNISLFIPSGTGICDTQGVCINTSGSWGKSIASNVSASKGYYDWTINRGSLPANTTITNNYKISVEVVNKSINDSSDNFFSIAPVPVTSASPVSTNISQDQLASIFNALQNVALQIKRLFLR